MVRATCSRTLAPQAALRAKEAQHRGEDVADADIPGFPAELTDLDDILFKDVGDVLKKDGRWPLIVDPSKQTSVGSTFASSLSMKALSIIMNRRGTLSLSIR